MKRIALIALFFAVAGAVATAAEMPTAAYDRSRLAASSDGRTIAYGNFAAVALGPHQLLPARTVLVKLEPGEGQATLTWSCDKWSEVGPVGKTVDLTDSPTGLATTVDRIDRGELPGTSPVWIGPFVEINQLRYLRLTLFPVSLSPEHTLRFAESLTLRLGERIITPDELLDPATVIDHRQREDFAGSSAGANSPLMVIVTNESMLSSARRLATYKTATGLTTIVVDIAGIIAGYSGRDDAERLREYLKDFAADGGAYVLLVGDETILPVRYAYHGSTSDTVPLTDLQICDLYFADLTGEWDADNDGVWGERFGDNADISPELRVGRLPFSRPEQLDAYREKLTAYQTAPGAGELAYLNRAFFFSSDEMRDYGGNGQHGLIASAYPASFEIDTIDGVEATSGGDPLPTNKSAFELSDILSDGAGIVNILAHGRPDLFAVRTTNYNVSPRSDFTTGPITGSNGTFDSLAANDRIGFYYSLACENGGFDEDRPPFVYTNPNIVEQLLALPHAGAIGFVAYSRWGWIGSSWLQQKAFFEELFAHPDRPAVDAMNAEKATYYYYRDIVLGQNYYGDPSVRIWTAPPSPLTLGIEAVPTTVTARVTCSGAAVAGCTVYVAGPSGRIETSVTGADGRAVLTYDFAPGVSYTVSAVKSGHLIALEPYAPSIVTGTDGDDASLPTSFVLDQNYPNPFNPSTVISFVLPRRTTVTLEIFNVNGRLVTTLIDRALSAGRHEIGWDGADSEGGAVASGVYLYRVTTDDAVQTRRMVLVK